MRRLISRRIKSGQQSTQEFYLLHRLTIFLGDQNFKYYSFLLLLLLLLLFCFFFVFFCFCCFFFVLFCFVLFFWWLGGGGVEHFQLFLGVCHFCLGSFCAVAVDIAIFALKTAVVYVYIAIFIYRSGCNVYSHFHM